MNMPSYRYIHAHEKPNDLYEAAAKCLEQLFNCLESGSRPFLSNGLAPDAGMSEHRIRVNFSTSVLAYFFKLLNKAGGLDAGPVTQLILAISKNFVTTGVGEGYISVNGLTTRYKQVVQGTANTLRALLLKMLKLLDEEFN